jgi:hypothetical protein
MLHTDIPTLPEKVPLVGVSSGVNKLSTLILAITESYPKILQPCEAVHRTETHARLVFREFACPPEHTAGIRRLAKLIEKGEDISESAGP